ncbi:MAG: TraR/DksA C4-type zinc finger protein [Candidatus Neomarinimicrobiota bacterium]
MTNKHYSKSKLQEFRKLILEKMEGVADEVGTIQDGINTARDASGGMSQDSIYGVHMADAGTDSHEREKSYLLMTREENYYRNLLTAIERIDTEEFGTCTICGELIPEERMIEVPNTNKCVSCKNKEKLNPV